MNKIIIKNEDAGQRLDKILAKNLNKFSRSQIQILIKKNLITVNQKIVPSHYSTKIGDVVFITEKTRKAKPALSVLPKDVATKKVLGPKIIAETKNYLVINKPAGLVVHGPDKEKRKFLVDFLLKKYPDIKNAGEDPSRPGIVHRLDKEASGLMVIARNQECFDNLKKQFQQRKIGKKYTALVYGKTSAGGEEINFPIRRSSKGYKMAALPITQRGQKNQEGKRAITKITIIKNYINYTLLKVETKTGRTHQVRVHLAAYGHPLAGDDLYGTPKTRIKNKKINLGRIFLVADELSFGDLSGKKQTFCIKLPQQLKTFLKKIK